MDEPTKRLVLHVEVPGFWADDLDEMARIVADVHDGMTPVSGEDYLYVVTEEWMREEVGITLVGRPGEKCSSDDFIVQAYTGRIVGAEARNIRP